jgi:hypothetical protein
MQHQRDPCMGSKATTRELYTYTLLQAHSTPRWVYVHLITHTKSIHLCPAELGQAHSMQGFTTDLRQVSNEETQKLQTHLSPQKRMARGCCSNRSWLFSGFRALNKAKCSRNKYITFCRSDSDQFLEGGQELLSSRPQMLPWAKGTDIGVFIKWKAPEEWG